MERVFRKSKQKKIVVAISGYFNPLHVGHLEMIKISRKLGDHLVAIVNNDKQVKLKGSVPFMKQADRMKIVRSLRDIDEVFLSIDKDKSVCASLAKLKPDIFAKGGDRNVGNIPEVAVCQKYGIKIVDGLGKKIRSSSILIKDASKKKKYAQKN